MYLTGNSGAIGRAKHEKFRKNVRLPSTRKGGIFFPSASIFVVKFCGMYLPSDLFVLRVCF